MYLIIMRTKNVENKIYFVENLSFRYFTDILTSSVFIISEFLFTRRCKLCVYLYFFGRLGGCFLNYIYIYIYI